jgi:polyhydroxybutyrate depolymerase
MIHWELKTRWNMKMLRTTLIFAMAVSYAFNSYGQSVRDRIDELGTKPYSLVVDGLERTYRIAVPRRGTGPMPLVLVLHGGGLGEPGAVQAIRYTQFTRVAIREGFVAVFPMGIDGNWNDGRAVDFIRTQKQDIDDVKFIRAVVDQVAQKHSIDRSRIFCTGISNGAFMSHRLAAEASDLVAAIAPVAGGMSPTIAQQFSPQYPVSLLVIQGDADPLVPTDGGGVSSRFHKERGRTISTHEIVGQYIRHNGVKGKPIVTKMNEATPNDGTTTTVSTYPPTESGAIVQVYMIENGGHTWPGKRQYLPEKYVGKTSRDFDATDAIWEFFKSCPPRGLR